MQHRFKGRAPLTIAIGLVTFGVAYSCVESPEDPPDPLRAQALASAGACVVDSSASFLLTAEELVEAVAKWQGDPVDADLLAEAQKAWDSAMSEWQKLEVMQFGPAGSSNSVDQGGSVGGQDLRDEIYSWPLINACRVDQGLVSEVWKSDLLKEPVNARGLDALEHLLFETDTENSCPATAAIVTDGSWDAIEDLASRRAQYALVAANGVLQAAKTLEHQWSPDGGDFANTLANAGNNDFYKDQRAALNSVIDALFYMESDVKDLKLALPLGISADCSTGTCPEDIEHPAARRSKQSIEDNLAGFEMIFAGCGKEENVGLAQLLREEGAGDLADQMSEAIDGIHKALDAIEEEDLSIALSDDTASLTKLHDAIKKLTDLLKLELPTVLDVSLPSTVGGDTD